MTTLILEHGLMSKRCLIKNKISKNTETLYHATDYNIMETDNLNIY
jgi:hypothetical protein